MRVGHVIPSIESSSGGPPRSTSATIRAINMADDTVTNTLLSTDYGVDDSWNQSLRAYLPENTEVKLFPVLGVHTLSMSVPLLRWLWENISALDVLVVRAMLHPISTACAWIARVQGVPYVLTPHGTLSRYTFEHRNTWLKRAYYRIFESKTLEGAERIHCTTKQERKQVEELGSTTPVRVIPHPYEPVKYQQEVHRDPNLILFLSRLDPMKGTELLIEAFGRIRSNHPRAQLVVAGSGDNSYESTLRDRVRKLELEEAVEFPGFVEGNQKKQLLRTASVFVLPSYRENFGIAAVEAMDAGLPVVVSTEVDTYPEIAEYEAGIVIAPEVEELADALDTLLSDRKKREKMSGRGRKLVQEEYDPETVGTRVLKMYRQAASK